MSKLSVVSYGEALVDLVQVDDAFSPFVGGAPANVAAAVAKLGGESYFVGAVGGDQFGQLVLNELQDCGIDTRHVVILDDALTPVAYVSLDAQGERSFSFARTDTADMRYPINQLPVELFEQQSGIFHFGSNCLTNDYLTAVSMAMLTLARQCGWSISFDVNLRPALWQDSAIDIERVLRFVAMADIIKMSQEEMQALGLDMNDRGKLSVMDLSDSAHVIVTSGPGVIEWYSRRSKFEIFPQKITAVDTTGAGDAFFGALLYYLTQAETPVDKGMVVSSEALEFAARCGAYSVQNYGAIQSYPRLDQLDQN